MNRAIATKAGINTLLHFSIPFSTPSITTPNTIPAKTSNQMTGCSVEDEKPVK